MKLYVFKFGTKLLIGQNGEIDHDYIKKAAEQIAWIKKQGHSVLVVTSGAVHIGLKKLQMKDKETINDTNLSQVASTVGNRYLFNIWAEAFSAFDQQVAMLLLTNDSVEKNPDLRVTLKTLLTKVSNAVIIANENDAMTTEELRYLQKEGDNDLLMMHLVLVLRKILTHKIRAVLCTDVDGIYDQEGKLIPIVENVSTLSNLEFGSQKQALGKGRGGMESKIRVAASLHALDIPLYIVNGRREDVLLEIYRGKNPGTLFKPTNGSLVLA